MTTTQELLNMPEVDRAKLTKAELLTALNSNIYSVRSDLGKLKDLEKVVKGRQSEYNVAIRMCAGFLGDNLLPEETYNSWNSVDYGRQDLPTLLARVFSRTVEEARRS